MLGAAPSSGAGGGGGGAATTATATAGGGSARLGPAAPSAAPPPTLTQLGAATSGSRLIGAEGSEYVANILRTVKPPQVALAQVQATAGLSHPLCGPLLCMLDYLDISRREAHLFILTRAKQLLQDWIASVKVCAVCALPLVAGDAVDSTLNAATHAGLLPCQHMLPLRRSVAARRTTPTTR
jgi:hypothetical protein